jgi:hypothetical protein
LNPLYHAITNVGIDPYVAALQQVGQGAHSFKVGNNDPTDKHADRLSYTFTVTALNAKFGI